MNRNMFQPTIRNRKLYSIFLIFSLIGVSVSAQQLNSKKLSPQQIVTLLQHPGGLRAAANSTGSFVLENEAPNCWGEPDLQTLVTESSAIVSGRVIEIKSTISPNGNDIFTEFKLRPDDVFKGSVGNDVIFVARGGKIVFPNGTSAEVRTLLWDKLKSRDGSYLVFLHKDSPEHDRYVLSGNAAGVFDMSATDGSFDPLASHDVSPHQITQEIASFSRKNLLDQIRAYVLAESTLK